MRVGLPLLVQTMLLKMATQERSPSENVDLLLQQGSGSGGSNEASCDSSRAVEPSMWPEGYKPIRRVKFTTIEDLLAVMAPQAQESVPLIIEGSDVVDTAKWADISYMLSMLSTTKVQVKKSPNHKFRYFDAKKNLGKFSFKQPVVETQQTAADFVAEAEDILQSGRPERMYLQETLSGHPEMAEEFASWRWEVLLRVSQECGWGLPDSNELFVGMPGIETPLHFDERENLFFQVRGRKELVTFPFVDYTLLYPFPTTHPCDRQSMVGSPFNANAEAFPNFTKAVGHHATLQAGDLVYLPYGWWHWLRNIDHLAISISFWSTYPPDDLSKGVPDVFTGHMLTRVRRNLESMVAQQFGPENHNESMLKIRDAILAKETGDPHLAIVRQLLKAVRMREEEQDKFLLEMIEGRFGVDWGLHVQG